MDSQKPTPPSNLLNDLESIRQLLEQHPLEPPLLTESIDPNSIPLLSDVVSPADLGTPRFNLSAPAMPAAATPASTAQAAPPPTPTPKPVTPVASLPAHHETISEQLQQRLHPAAIELNRLDRELRTAAHLMLQDIIDDFVPLIEAELKTRLDDHLNQLLSQRKR